MILSPSSPVQGRQGHPPSQRSAGATPFITGGNAASYNEYPYTVSIQYQSVFGSWSHTCGGFLYNNRYVVTAAHCVDNMEISRLRVMAGALNLNSDPQGQIVAVASYKLHENYTIDTGFPNDIAIVTLQYSITTGGSSTADNAPLPPDDTDDFVQSNCFISGWGQTDPSDTTPSATLQELQIPVITNSDCANYLIQIDNAAVFDTHICILADNRDVGPCKLDGGSPLTCCGTPTDCTTKYVVGVQSSIVSNNGQCNLIYPTVDVRISKYLSWINVNAA